MQLLSRAVAAHVASSGEARDQVAGLIADHIVPGYKVYALTHSGPFENGWVGGAQTGNYGPNYRTRTSVDLLGIWGNTPEEAVYFNATHDGDGNALNGSNSYVVEFPADDLPGEIVDSYWSVIALTVPDFRVIPNDENRYNLNSFSDLAVESGGSLKIGFGPQPPPGVPASNWLPTAPGKPSPLPSVPMSPAET